MVLIVEDDSRMSRLLRSHFEQSFPKVRVEIAGSAAKAKVICENHPPTLIIWDGFPNERGTREEYAACIPDHLWGKVIPISADAECLAHAQSKGAMAAHPKPEHGHHTWSEKLAHAVKSILNPGKK